jgi:hypothetical protein
MQGVSQQPISQRVDAVQQPREHLGEKRPKVLQAMPGLFLYTCTPALLWQARILHCTTASRMLPQQPGFPAGLLEAAICPASTGSSASDNSQWLVQHWQQPSNHQQQCQ